MNYADLSQPVKLAANARREEIAAELADFVSPPFAADEYPVVLAIASGALTGSSLTS